MMIGRQLPGLGLMGYWREPMIDQTPGSDDNLLLLSIVTQMSVRSKTETTWVSEEGALYIEPTQGSIYVFDDGAWKMFLPRKGYLTFVEDERKYYAYDGTTWCLAVTLA